LVARMEAPEKRDRDANPRSQAEPLSSVATSTENESKNDSQRESHQRERTQRQPNAHAHQAPWRDEGSVGENRALY
jgi:hypothetical protein